MKTFINKSISMSYTHKRALLLTVFLNVLIICYSKRGKYVCRAVCYLYMQDQKRIEIKKLLMYTNETLLLMVCAQQSHSNEQCVENRRTEERRNKTHISTKNTLSGLKLCLQHDLNKYALLFCFCQVKETFVFM